MKHTVRTSINDKLRTVLRDQFTLFLQLNHRRYQWAILYWIVPCFYYSLKEFILQTTPRQSSTFVMPSRYTRTWNMEDRSNALFFSTPEMNAYAADPTLPEPLPLSREATILQEEASIYRTFLIKTFFSQFSEKPFTETMLLDIVQQVGSRIFLQSYLEKSQRDVIQNTASIFWLHDTLAFGQFMTSINVPPSQKIISMWQQLLRHFSIDFLRTMVYISQKKSAQPQ